MEILPVWHGDQLVWELPLDQISSWQLTLVLCTKDPAERLKHLIDWFRNTPTGLIWAAGNYLESQRTWPRGEQSLAAWFLDWWMQREIGCEQFASSLSASKSACVNENRREFWSRVISRLLVTAARIEERFPRHENPVRPWVFFAEPMSTWLLGSPTDCCSLRAFAEWQHLVAAAGQKLRHTESCSSSGVNLGQLQQDCCADMALAEWADTVARVCREIEEDLGSIPFPSIAWLATDLHPSYQLMEMLIRLKQWRRLDEGFNQELRRAKLTALKEFAYGASHELNNPLANIAMRAQALLSEETHVEKRRKLATIVHQAFRAHEMIADLMLFVQPPKPEKKRVAVTTLVQEVFNQLKSLAEEQGTEVRYCSSVPEHLEIHADPRQLSVALQTVCTNALEAIGAGGWIEIELTERSDSPLGRRGVEIAVRDSGPGISEKALRHAFDPYFSGREAGRGLGLGLSKCWSILEQHGGKVELQNAPQGAVVRLVLPGGEIAENEPSAIGEPLENR